MKSASSWVGASRMRCPSARSIITSVTEPYGDSGHMPTTSRVPDSVPMPAMAPSNFSMCTTVGERDGRHRQAFRVATARRRRVGVLRARIRCASTGSEIGRDDVPHRDGRVGVPRLVHHVLPQPGRMHLGMGGDDDPVRLRIRSTAAASACIGRWSPSSPSACSPSLRRSSRVASSRACAALTVSSQTHTAPVCSACPVSTGLAGTQTKYSALPSRSIACSSSSSSEAPTVSLASTSTLVPPSCAASSKSSPTEPPRHLVSA